MKLHSLPPIFLLFCSQMLNKPVWGLGAGDPLPLMIFQYKIHHFWQQKQLILCLNRKFGVLRHSWNLRIRKQTKQTKKPEFLCNADVLMWKNSIDLQKSLKRNHSWIFFFFPEVDSKNWKVIYHKEFFRQLQCSLQMFVYSHDLQS